MNSLNGSQITCPACGESEIREFADRGKQSCRSCGFVLPTNENEATNADSILQQVDLDDESDSTDSNWKDQVAIEDKSDTELIQLLALTEQVAEDTGLGEEVIIQSGELVTRAWKSNFMHGRRKDETVAAAVYITSRKVGSAVPPGVLAQVSGVEKSSLKDTYTKLKNELGLDVNPARPVQFVDFLCDQFGLSNPVRSEAKKSLNELDTSPGNPIGVASGAVYSIATSNGEDVTLDEIGKVVEITKETVWRHSKNFRERE